MRVLTYVSCLMFALPVAAQSQSCKGEQAFALEGGTQGCIVKIGEGETLTTTTRDDGASSRSHRKTQPFVAAVMTGSIPASRKTVKKQMLAMCKFTQAKVSEQFAGKKYHQIILYMDWRKSGGELEASFSSDKCRGIRFFDN